MERAARAAAEPASTGAARHAGAGPGYLTGYAPTAITERLTLLRAPADGARPRWSCPALERPDAEARRARRGDAASTGGRHRPVRAAGAAARPRRAVRDLRRGLGACTCSACRGRCPAALRRLTDGLPMLRAVKDADELERLAAAGAAADAAFEEILDGALRRPDRDRGGGRPRRPAAQARALPGGLHRRRLRAQRRQPAPRGRRAGHRGGRHGGAGLRRAARRLRLGHHPHRARRASRPTRCARCTRWCGGPSRPAFEAVRPGRRVPGDRPGGPAGHHRGRLRRVLHPPRRPRDRA